MPSKFKLVRFQLVQLNVDPAQYKPYSHTLTAENIFVDVPVDESEMTKTGDQIILTVDGLVSILQYIAEPITKMDNERRAKNFGH